jgi:calcineurin-like phosphoesterase family protein
MSNVFHISDTHFGHERIISLCDRPFKDVYHMNETIVDNWNQVVEPEDIVYHHGDVALGRIVDSLPHVGRLNGHIVLIEGNHDRPFMDKHKEAKRARWLEEYGKYFDEIYPNIEGASMDYGVYVNLSHFPYDGDSHGADRHGDARIVDDGITPLIHGHTHSSGNPVSRSKARGTLQIHVGVDAWDFYPVPHSEVKALIDANL